MAVNGALVLLMVNTGTVETPTWTAVGYQRDVTFEEATEEIDISSKESRAKKVLPGRYSATISLDALFVPSDTAYAALKSAARNGDQVQVARQYNGSEEEKIMAIVTSLSEGFPDQDGAVCSATLVTDGEWEAVV